MRRFRPNSIPKKCLGLEDFPPRSVGLDWDRRREKLNGE